MRLDFYWLHARLYPALLTVMPAVAVVAAFLPNLFAPGSGKWMATSISAFGGLYAMAIFSRSRGKRVEKTLLGKWGAWPSTIWLRHRSDYLSPSTLTRYHQYLLKNVPGLRIPTTLEEEKDQTRSDEFYNSAVDWLKEKSRKDSLVQKEVAEYGFRRNLLGLKPVGISVCFVTLIGGALCMQFEIGWESYHEPIFSKENFGLMKQFSWVILAEIFNLITLGLWLFGVSEKWVRASADQYARALLAVCDSESK